MADILSQEEIDALLTQDAAMEFKKLGGLLKGRGIVVYQVDSFLRELVGLRSGDLPSEARQARALEALDSLLVGVTQSRKRLNNLRLRVQRFVAPQEPPKGDILTQEEINEVLSVTEGSDEPSVAPRANAEEPKGAVLSIEDKDHFAMAVEGSDDGGGGVSGEEVSQEEVLSFLEGREGRYGESGDGVTRSDEVASQTIATAYDFKHPARVNKDQLRTLESLHDHFARLLGNTFSGAMRAVVDVDTAFVDQTTYAEFIMSLSNPSCSYQFTLGPTHGQAIMDFAMPVAFAFVDRIFGGKGSSQGVDARQLTAIEMGVLNKIVKRVIEDLEATWESILRVEISDVELETNPEFMQITAASEIVILLAFEVKAANCSGLVSLCYPFFTLESILPRLGQQSYARQTRANKDELLRSNRLRLEKTYLPLRAELARGMVSIQDLENLQEGDVLRFDTPTRDLTIVFVGEEPKFYARPFLSTETQRNSLLVVGRVSQEDEEIFKNRCRPVPI